MPGACVVMPFRDPRGRPSGSQAGFGKPSPRTCRCRPVRPTSRSAPHNSHLDPQRQRVGVSRFAVIRHPYTVTSPSEPNPPPAEPARARSLTPVPLARRAKKPIQPPPPSANAEVSPAPGGTWLASDDVGPPAPTSPPTITYQPADGHQLTQRPASQWGGAGTQPTPTGAVGSLIQALTHLRQTLVGTGYALPLPTAAQARRTTAATVAQIDDYLVPRLLRLDAPLLVVVGGSTGAGKSTLVNSLVRAPVSPSGVLRPTTRAPVLVCSPSDAPWFAEHHLLPGVSRTSGPSELAGSLQVVPAQGLATGLAFLDAPDIDSVVEDNSALAVQLLNAADLWLFVTTAARYADAVPWELLRTAGSRGTVVALVLDRVPAGASDEIGPHLTAMLRENGLGGSPLFVLPETTLDGQGLLAERVISPLRGWFDRLAGSAAARDGIVSQTVDGAINAMNATVAELEAAADDQVTALHALDDVVRAAYRDAYRAVESGVHDGVLLRGEVLSRWQELVGTGDLARALQARMGRARDRIVARITGRPVPGRQLQVALESCVATLIRSAADDAAEHTAAVWRANPAGAHLLSPELSRSSPDLHAKADALVQNWQKTVLDLVRQEARGKLALAKAGAYAVNATGLLVMVGVFAATAFVPTGAEVAAAAGTTVAGQKVLEAVFGDQAIRTLAEQASADLLARVRNLLNAEAERYDTVLNDTGVDLAGAQWLRDATTTLTNARHRAQLSGGVAAPKPSVARTSQP